MDKKAAISVDAGEWVLFLNASNILSNIDEPMNKIELLKLEVIRRKPLVVGIVETWLSSENDISQYKRQIYDYKNTDWEVFRHKLSLADWASIFNEKLDLSDKVKAWTNFILRVVEECIPHKRISVSSRDSPWFNNDLKHLLKIRDKKYHKAKKNDKYRKQYEEFAWEFEKLCDTAKKQYYEKQSTELNTSSKKWWT
ncbi:unnamed protein product, partial [Didymodactylos carnosus]